MSHSVIRNPCHRKTNRHQPQKRCKGKILDISHPTQRNQGHQKRQNPPRQRHHRFSSGNVEEILSNKLLICRQHSRLISQNGNIDQYPSRSAKRFRSNFRIRHRISSFRNEIVLGIYINIQQSVNHLIVLILSLLVAYPLICKMHTT